MRPLALTLAIGLAAAIPAALCAAPAPAPETSCDSPKSGFDQAYCERKVFMQADTELNAVYRKLRAQLKPSDRQTLLSSQRSWIHARDQSCSRNSDANVTVDLVCTKDATIQRTNWLTDRLRECTSSGCRSSLLGD